MEQQRGSDYIVYNTPSGGVVSSVFPNTSILP